MAHRKKYAIVANKFYRVDLQTVFVVKFCFIKMRCPIVTFACIITLILAYIPCTAQAPRIADSVLYHFKSIRSIADSNHLKAALGWMQKKPGGIAFRSRRDQ